ncbi:MAG: helix-turn-helix domain-containing protein [Solirubrobacterales bacterium]|nr:helix-turn-helix domain-containing protein [Solirubrobacterales bacterium]
MTGKAATAPPSAEAALQPKLAEHPHGVNNSAKPPQRIRMKQRNMVICDRLSAQDESVTHPDYIREKVIQLRREKKLTIDEIAERLAISRTTAYNWVKDIEIPRKPGWNSDSPAHLIEAQRRGTVAMQEKYRNIRAEAYRQGLKEFAEMSESPGFRDFVCMYIGEGYKRNRNVVGLGNSDPTVVMLANDWITRLSRNKIQYSIQFHADQSLDELRSFWSECLAIEPEQIKFQRKSNSGKLGGRNWRSRHGVLTVRTSDTRLRARLQSWMDLVRDDWK